MTVSTEAPRWQTIPTGLLLPPKEPIRVRASYGTTIVAETNQPVIYECRPYFPLDSVDLTRLELSSSHTICPWTGRADYFTVTTGEGERIQKGAWTYRRVIPGARRIRHHVAFWRGVTIAISQS